MKKRLMKKWIKRYIHPLIKDLKNTDGCGTWDMHDGLYAEWKPGKNCTIVNGYLKPEGTILPAPYCYYKGRLAVMKTAEKVKQVRYLAEEWHNVSDRKVYLRVAPIFNQNGDIRMRLIIV